MTFCKYYDYIAQPADQDVGIQKPVPGYLVVPCDEPQANFVSIEKYNKLTRAVIELREQIVQLLEENESLSAGGPGDRR